MTNGEEILRGHSKIHPISNSGWEKVDLINWRGTGFVLNAHTETKEDQVVEQARSELVWEWDLFCACSTSVSNSITPKHIIVIRALFAN